MIEPWAKRAFVRAALVAVTHSALWTGYIHHIQTVDFLSLEQHQAVIRSLDWTRDVPGMSRSRYEALYLNMQPLTPRGAPTQFVVKANQRLEMEDYFKRHRAGDVVPVWIDRRNGAIERILPPEAPDFLGLLRLLMLTVGTFTFVLAIMILMWTHRPNSPKEN